MKRKMKQRIKQQRRLNREVMAMRANNPLDEFLNSKKSDADLEKALKAIASSR